MRDFLPHIGEIFGKYDKKEPTKGMNCPNIKVEYPG
jgi:hypothetical protein